MWCAALAECIYSAYSVTYNCCVFCNFICQVITGISVLPVCARADPCAPQCVSVYLCDAELGEIALPLI